MNETQVNGYGISPQQDLVWRTAQHQDGRASTVAALVGLRGPLDVERLGRAAERVVERHEILRTRLLVPAGYLTPIQVISEEPALALEFDDLSGLPEVEQRQRVAAVVAQARATEPVLQADPLELRVLRIGASRHFLVLKASAGALDRASALLLIEAFARAYSSAGEPADEEPLQYADLAEWLNERARDGRFESPPSLDGIEDGAVPVRLPFELPFGRQSGKTESGVSGHSVVGIEDLIPSGAERAAGDLGCGLRDLLLAAWHVALYRYAGSETLLTGLTESGRNVPELSTAIGPLARLLPVQASIADETSFRQVVESMRSACAVAESDAELFNPLWWSNRDRDTTPVVPAFDLIELGGPHSADDVLFTPLAVHGVHPSAGLSLCVQQVGATDGHAELVFDANRFRAEDVTALGAVLRNVLAHVVEDVDSAVGTVRVWTSEPASTEARTVLGRFVAQVASRPDAIAVEDSRESLTYRRLDQASARLAAVLVSQNIGRGSVVPVLLERGVHVITAMLGVWRAGASFTILDEATPQGRMSAILADTSATAVITSGGLAGRLPDTSATRVLIEDLPESASTVAVPNEPSHLAYVVYTSGSTGTPKGVMVSHGAVANYVQGIGSRLPASQGTSFAIVSTLAADLGYTAVFSALSSGGLLSVVPTSAATDASGLEAWFSSREIDCLKIVPSHLSALIAAADNPDRILPRRLLVLGGEACPVDLVERIRRLAPDCAVVNHYGPTETTIGVCTFRADGAELDPRVRSVPIGTPLPGNRAEVFDRSRRVLPAWMPGELYVSGAQVSQGYLHQAAMTAERFVTESSGRASAVRWYRTGDIVRRLPDGSLEYLGRADDQVKINGFRVELQEIESVLWRYEGVRECAIAVTGDPDRVLTAYVVRERAEVSVDEIRDHARHLLPEYMVPRAVVFVDALPRTANAKIDKAALLAIDPPPSGGTGAAVGPRDSLEFRMLEIWQSLLKSDQLGVTDDFFEAGGHSLLSLQLLAEISRQLGHRLPISVLFDAGTVEGMARAVREQESWKSQTLVPIRVGGTRPPLFCVHAGGGSVMGYLHLVRAISPDVPVYGLESIGLDGVEAPLTRVQEMAEQYAAEIVALNPTGPCGIIGWGLGGVFAYAVAERLRSLGRSVGTLSIIDGAAPDPRALAEAIEGRSSDPYYLGMLDDDVVARFAVHYELSVSESDLAGKSDEQQRAVLTAAMREQNVLAMDAGVEHLEALFSVYRSNIAAVLDYVQHFQVGDKPNYPVLLLRAKHELNADEADPLLGWPSLFDDRITVEWFAGDHYEVMRPPTVEHLAVLIEKAHASGSANSAAA